MIIQLPQPLPFPRVRLVVRGDGWKQYAEITGDTSEVAIPQRDEDVDAFIEEVDECGQLTGAKHVIRTRTRNATRPRNNPIEGAAVREGDGGNDPGSTQR